MGVFAAPTLIQARCDRTIACECLGGPTPSGNSFMPSPSSQMKHPAVVAVCEAHAGTSRPAQLTAARPGPRGAAGAGNPWVTLHGPSAPLTVESG